MKVYCADLFCGAGGTSSGLIEAALELDFEVELVAINHWLVAIATHSANYPWATHICARVEEIRPRDVVPRGRLHLLVASPECTFHSVARGGRPVEDQKRVPAWGVIHWAQELYIENIIIENVPEFVRWGPLGANGRPLKSKIGETYQAFLQALRSLGYRVDERVLCCADYGDATRRKRLFIVATRKGIPSWPLPSHGQRNRVSLQTSLWYEENQRLRYRAFPRHVLRYKQDTVGRPAVADSYGDRATHWLVRAVLALAGFWWSGATRRTTRTDNLRQGRGADG